MSITLRNPAATQVTLRDSMDRMLEQAFAPFVRGSFADSPQAAGSGYAPTNLWEDAHNYHVHILAPGAEADSIDITATNGMLVISGKLSLPTPEGAKALWQEWAPATFRRQVQLPAGFNADGVHASYKDGVLTVTVPKPEEMKPKSIKINVAS
jgi:HSP20 family protein